ncbi:ABC transporter ATP-binding protein [Acuticoccus sp. 2012]|uniref:ABC transporter ATP-binding protein n=1 Tax=Acuticoccus mangrovi TaxID=2796142 RepID=A0A934ITJ9_9HYPH|nr:ABC transporter ATP-binding protein [Acuticoccus mangrovi]
MSGLTVRYGAFRAVDDLALHVPAGRLTAVIGPNGAGKTTFFNAVSGLVRPAAGRILFDGADLAGRRPDEITAAGLVRTFQIARGFPRLTVFEHLMLYAQDNPGEGLWAALTGARRREAEIAERALAVAARLKLTRVLDNRVTDISGGQKKLLEIGRGLMAEPRLLLLDEPVAGVNPTLAEEIGDQLVALVAGGLTLLLIEHDMALVERIADHVIVMAEGRRLAEGSFAEIRDDHAVQEAYLGGGVLADADG